MATVAGEEIRNDVVGDVCRCSLGTGPRVLWYLALEGKCCMGMVAYVRCVGQSKVT